MISRTSVTTNASLQFPTCCTKITMSSPTRCGEWEKRSAVAAETEALAEKAVRAIKVEYEVLPVITDPIEAIEPGAEPIYDNILWGDREIEVENNIACARDVDEGDAAPAG